MSCGGERLTLRNGRQENFTLVGREEINERSRGGVGHRDPTDSDETQQVRRKPRA